MGEANPENAAHRGAWRTLQYSDERGRIIMLYGAFQTACSPKNGAIL